MKLMFASSTVLTNSISGRLSSLLTPSERLAISDSVQNIKMLPGETRDAVRQVFSDGYSAQLRVMLYFSIVVWLLTLLLWERKPRTAKSIEGY